MDETREQGDGDFSWEGWIVQMMSSRCAENACAVGRAEISLEAKRGKFLLRWGNEEVVANLVN